MFLYPVLLLAYGLEYPPVCSLEDRFCRQKEAWTYLGHFFGIYLIYIWHIFGTSLAHLGHIISISLVYFGHNFGISLAYL